MAMGTCQTSTCSSRVGGPRRSPHHPRRWTSKCHGQRISPPGRLPSATSKAVLGAVEAAMQEDPIVGLSAAFVANGEVVEVLSFGWEDFAARAPATDRTVYRWASVSKPLTAVAALQLVAAGELDLDEDIRELVPEYDKGAVITAYQLLVHQAGLPHYEQMKVRTIKDYDTPHPWADRILALDMFVESDLASTPGSQFQYSSPGFVVLGAVIERAGEGTYADQVRKRICKPLGMESMQPDYIWNEVPQRSAAYQSAGEGAVEVVHDDISWKLPAGGWMSTAGDMGRFVAGLMGADVLDTESRKTMWTLHTDFTDEGITGYGMGLILDGSSGQQLLSHSGGQVGASTFFLCNPGTGYGVAIAANTEGVGVSDLTERLLEILTESEL